MSTGPIDRYRWSLTTKTSLVAMALGSSYFVQPMLAQHLAPIQHVQQSNSRNPVPAYTPALKLNDPRETYRTAQIPPAQPIAPPGSAFPSPEFDESPLDTLPSPQVETVPQPVLVPVTPPDPRALAQPTMTLPPNMSPTTAGPVTNPFQASPWGTPTGREYFGNPRPELSGGPIPGLGNVASPGQLESPVSSLFRNIIDDMGVAQEQEAEQFESMLERLQRMQEAMERQQRQAELLREMQAAREAAELERPRNLPPAVEDNPADAVAGNETQSDPTGSDPEDAADDAAESGDEVVDAEAMPPDPENMIPDEPSLPDALATSDPATSAASTANDDTAAAASENLVGTAGEPDVLPGNAVQVTSTVDRMALADNLFSSGQFRLAGMIYSKLLHEQLSNEERAWAEYQLATCYRAIGDIPNARKHFLTVAGTKGVDTYATMATWWLSHLGQQERFDQRARAIQDGISQKGSGGTP